MIVAPVATRGVTTTLLGDVVDVAAFVFCRAVGVAVDVGDGVQVGVRVGVAVGVLDGVAVSGLVIRVPAVTVTGP